MKHATLSAVPNESDLMTWRFEEALPHRPATEEAPARHVRFHTSLDRTMNLQIWEFWGQLACKTWQMLEDGIWLEGAALLDDFGLWHVSSRFPKISDLKNDRGRVIGSKLELALPVGGAAQRTILNP